MPMLKNSTMQTCTALGISTIEGKLSDLKKLETSIHKNLSDLANAKNHQEMSAYALLGLKLTIACCDAFIALASEAASLIGMGAPAKMVSNVYTGASALGTAATETALGQKTNWTDTAGKVIVSSAGFVAGKAEVRSDLFKNFNSNRIAGGMLSNPSINEAAARAALTAENASVAASVVEQGKFKVDFLFLAIDKDEAGVKEAFANYAKSVVQIVSSLASDKLGGIVSILITLDKFNDDISMAFDECLESKDISSLDGVKRSLEMNLRRVHSLIDKFQKQLNECINFKDV